MNIRAPGVLRKASAMARHRSFVGLSLPAAMMLIALLGSSACGAQSPSSAPAPAHGAGAQKADNTAHPVDDTQRRTERADPADFARFCEQAQCRRDLRVRLRRADGGHYDETFPLMPPAVQAGFISVHAGETVRAVAVFEKGRFAGWRAPQADEPAETQVLTIALSQSDENPGMLAHVSTNTGPALKLRMSVMRLDGSHEPEPTSSCPLQAGGSSVFEMWPYPIFLVVVDHARHLAPGDSMACE